MRVILLIAVLFYSSMAWTQFQCFNDNILSHPLTLDFIEGGWVLESSSGKCETKVVDH